MLPDGKPRAFGADPRVFRASALVPRHHAPLGAPLGASLDGESWPPPGFVIELTGGFDGAGTSLAVAAVASVQQHGGITAWLQPRHGLLFPPDCAASGVDLDALAVIHVPPASPAASGKRSAHDLPKAAELLLRSGAFDLLVLDLRQAPPRSGAWLGRLQALAREHHSRVLLLTDAAAPMPFGTGLSQRLCVRRQSAGDAFVIEPQLVRDKLHGTPPPASLPRRGPEGLR